MAEKKNAAWRKAVSNGALTVPEHSSSAYRFRDNDELKYSLRSLEICMPWIRKVFLITDDQAPAWIDRKEVVIVDHKDIFPDKDDLPTFNSHGIEFCQHRIEGLAECFISFNDDFMLNKIVKKSDFFTKDGDAVIWVVKFSGKHKGRLLAADYDHMDPHKAGETRARRMILDRFDAYMPYRVRHYPRAMLRSTMEEIWERFPDAINATLSSPFRSVRDVAPHAFFAYYSIAHEKGNPRVINGVRQIADAMVGRLRNMGATVGTSSFKKKMAMIRRLKPLTVCFNDSDRASIDDRMKLSAFLKERYPLPSRFEKQCSSKSGDMG